MSPRGRQRQAGRHADRFPATGKQSFTDRITLVPLVPLLTCLNTLEFSCFVVHLYLTGRACSRASSSSSPSSSLSFSHSCPTFCARLAASKVSLWSCRRRSARIQGPTFLPLPHLPGLHVGLLYCTKCRPPQVVLAVNGQESFTVMKRRTFDDLKRYLM